MVTPKRNGGLSKQSNQPIHDLANVAAVCELLANQLHLHSNC